VSRIRTPPQKKIRDLGESKKVVSVQTPRHPDIARELRIESESSKLRFFGLSIELTDFEREVYEFIKKHGELLTTNIPSRMIGAIPNLKNKGLIEVHKRVTGRWTSKKRKFVKAIAS